MPYGYFILSRPVDSTLKFKINVLLPSSGRENQLEKRESCSWGAGGGMAMLSSRGAKGNEPCSDMAGCTRSYAVGKGRRGEERTHSSS